MKNQDPSALRVSILLRGLAFLLDLGLFAGLAIALVSAIDYAASTLLGGSGANLNASLASTPVFVMYFLYFSSESMMQRTLGKQLVGIEIRAENGLTPPNEALFKRFILKHGWAFLLFMAYIVGIEWLNWISYAWLGFIAIGVLGALSKNKQTLYDQSTKLAVFPTKTPRADLTTLSQGKSEEELVEEVKEIQQKFGTSESVKRTAKATLTSKDFPCAVELKVYVRDDPDVEELIYQCFAQYIPNVHRNQVQLSTRKKGPYRACRVVMQFNSPAQMETSYASLAKLPSVVTTTTVRSVKVSDNKRKKSREVIKAQPSMG